MALLGGDPVHLLQYGAGAFAAYYIFSSFVSWFRLRHVPGPTLASFSHIWLIRNTFRGNSHAQLLSLKRYGSLVRVAPNYVLTDDPAILRHISGIKSTYDRDDWFTGVRLDSRDNLLTTLDTAAHDRLKAKLANGYNGRDNVDIEGGLDDQIANLKELIRRHYLSTPTEIRKADLVWIVRFFTMDAVTALAYGEPFGYMETNEDLFGFNQQVQDGAKIMSVVVDTPFLRTLFKSPLLSPFMPKASDAKGVGRLIGLGQELVGKHFGPSSDSGNDMVSSFMRHGLSRDQCETESVVQVIAGADTTGTTIRSALLFIMGTPRVYSRLMKEAREAINSGKVSSSQPITFKQGKQLPYLQAVVYEAIRVRPPALYGHFKSVPAGGDTLNGVYLPAGTAISHNIYGLMMSENIFGQDVEIYRPERFLECDATTRAEMERTVEFAFGYGRWVCAGKHVAFTQLYKVIFELLRTFDFQPLDPVRPAQESSGLFWYHTNMWVRITELVDDI
ncbi:cytochrome P450 [Periconia macrospinosa]|uniref:Cytochrome P450 n=1 Tax=Periconia macrospinosa TaxID=97972 RepID=A0A2V1E0A6_9PLEO|nr:cytochrome P450 [Periconia macrospinosa]